MNYRNDMALVIVYSCSRILFPFHLRAYAILLHFVISDVCVCARTVRIQPIVKKNEEQSSQLQVKFVKHVTTKI